MGVFDLYLIIGVFIGIFVYLIYQDLHSVTKDDPRSEAEYMATHTDRDIEYEIRCAIADPQKFNWIWETLEQYKTECDANNTLPRIDFALKSTVWDSIGKTRLPFRSKFGYLKTGDKTVDEALRENRENVVKLWMAMNNSMTAAQAKMSYKNHVLSQKKRTIAYSGRESLFSGWDWEHNSPSAWERMDALGGRYSEGEVFLEEMKARVRNGKPFQHLKDLNPILDKMAREDAFK